MGRAFRGFALPLVLWLIALLVAGIALLVQSAATQAMQSRSMERRIAGEAAARAAIEYASLRMDPRLGAMAWQADGQPRAWSFNGFSVDIIIRDEAGKLDVNSGDMDVMRALLQLSNLAPGQAEAVMSGLAAMHSARLLRRDGFATASGTPQRLFNVAAIGQLPGVTSDTVAIIAPHLTAHSGMPLPDAAAADSTVRAALEVAGKRATDAPVATGMLTGGSGLNDIEAVARRDDRIDGRMRVILQSVPRYDGGMSTHWLAWEHGRWLAPNR